MHSHDFVCRRLLAWKQEPLEGQSGLGTMCLSLARRVPPLGWVIITVACLPGSFRRRRSPPCELSESPGVGRHPGARSPPCHSSGCAASRAPSSGASARPSAGCTHLPPGRPSNVLRLSAMAAAYSGCRSFRRVFAAERLPVRPSPQPDGALELPPAAGETAGRCACSSLWHGGGRAGTRGHSLRARSQLAPRPRPRELLQSARRPPPGSSLIGRSDMRRSSARNMSCHRKKTLSRARAVPREAQCGSESASVPLQADIPAMSHMKKFCLISYVNRHLT